MVVRIRRDLLLKFAGLFTTSREQAEDLVQETLLKAFLHSAKIEPGKEVAWARTVLRNRAFNDSRAAAYRKKLAERVGAEHVLHGESPDEAFERSEERDLIERALLRVTAQHAQILRLRHEEDLAYHEIAARLGVPLGTVMSRLSRAHAAFRTAVEDELLEAA